MLLDWAGTTMDFGCIAPAVVFVEVFERQGVPISLAEAREPMGAHKRVHIEKITRQDAVRRRWRRPTAGCTATPTSRRCSRPSAAAVRCLAAYSADPGHARDGRGAAGGASGSARPRAIPPDDRDQPAGARRQGYEPDFDGLGLGDAAGRSLPLHVPAERDQPQRRLPRRLREGRRHHPGRRGAAHAGMWSVGLAVSGNEVGLSLADWQHAAGRRAGRRGASAPTAACCSRAPTTWSTDRRSFALHRGHRGPPAPRRAPRVGAAAHTARRRLTHRARR